MVAHVVGDVSGVKLNGSVMGPRAMTQRRVRRSVTAFFKSSAVLDSVLPVRTYFRSRLKVPLRLGQEAAGLPTCIGPDRNETL